MAVETTEAIMIDEASFKTVDRAGQVIGCTLTVAAYALVLWPLLRAMME